FCTVLATHSFLYLAISRLIQLKEANLTIALSAEDYVTFLHTVLTTHGKQSISLESCLFCQTYVFPAKSKDAIDVDNAADFTNHKLMKKLDKILACHWAMYNIMGDSSIKGEDRKNQPSCSSDKGSGLNTTSSTC
ncbi:hypothetical protein BDR04DRAFT_1107020, partial [Suillus decipiens]